MTTSIVVEAVGMTLLAGVVVAILPIEWHKPRPYDATFQLNRTVLGERTARAIRRSLPACTGVVCAMAIGALLRFVRGLVELSNGVVQGVAGLAIVGFLFFAGALIGVVLVNSPKWLVPPHLRGEPGWLAYTAGRQSSQ
jgi:hypothetical protein